jgi:hypothetical protein
MSAGTRMTDGPAGRGDLDSAESRRSTEQIKLRLRPDEALRLRTAADTSGRTLSDFVVALLDGRNTGDHPATAADERKVALAEVSRLANALYALAENLRLSRGDLGRGLGLMKNLFNEAAVVADRHRFAIDDAIRDVRRAIVRADESSGTVADAVRQLRAEIEVTVRRLVRM